MSRRPIIAGNWKMNLQRSQAVALARGIAERQPSDSPVDVILCPPSVYLDAVVQAVRGTRIAVGAQNIYHEGAGAFTGEISGVMVRDVGARFVILGHSERRHLLGETDADVLRKVKAALQVELTPIVCVGEQLAQRDAGETEQVIAQQFAGSLSELTDDQIQRTIIAYEPVWAIGTGRVATPQQAEEVHAQLRELLRVRYHDGVAENVRIQYGGSVKADNAGQLLAQPNIDGALVGGASLDVDGFLAIVYAASA